MAQDADIARLLALLGVPDDRTRQERNGEERPRSEADETFYDLETGEDDGRLSRLDARLLSFLSDQLREWLDGGDPAGAMSDLRWSIVGSDGAQWMEVRVGTRPPMRFSRGVAAASLVSMDQLRDFANGRP